MSTRVIPYENLTWAELDSLNRDKTVILVAVAPMEQHGYHLPLGTDFFECITIMERVGEELKEKVSDLNVLMYPPIPVGTGTMDKTGTVEFRQETVKNIIYELGQSLAIYGFKHIIVLGCHGAPTFAVAIEEACEELNQQYGDIIFPPMGYYLSQIFVSRPKDAPEEIRQMAERFPRDWHAGFGETSMMLNINPELVKDYRKCEPVEVDVIKLLDRKAADRYGKGLGHFGYPAQSSKQFGKLMLDYAIKVLTKMSINFLKRENYKQYLHTPYWNLPHLRTKSEKQR